MFTGRPERLRSFPYAGFHRYSLTFCTDRRRPVFTAAEKVDVVRVQILRAAQETSFAVLAYCFMPDHVHLLVHGNSEAADLKRFIARAKQYSGFHYARCFGERLWQRYGYERVLRESETTESVIRYLLENPIRAGLVHRVEDYPFLGSFASTRDDLIEAIRQTPFRSG